MGFYSEIYIKAEPLAAVKLIPLLQQYDLDFDITKDDDYFYFQHANLKWYSNFADVRAITQFIENTYDAGKEICLVAINEDNTTDYWGQPGLLYTRVEIDGFDVDGIDSITPYLQEHYPELLI